MVELERRYRISESEGKSLVALTNWSEPVRIVDITFGVSGPTSMQTAGWIVRLRKLTDSQIMEFKAAANDKWTLWETIEVEVSHLGRAAAVLMKIGLKPGLVIDRIRRTSQFGGLLLSLDRVQFLGDFLEIEAPNISSDQFDQQVQELAEVLRANLDKLEVRPYGELLLELRQLDQRITQSEKAYLMELLNGI